MFLIRLLRSFGRVFFGDTQANRARYLLQSTFLVIIFLGLGKVTGFVRIQLVSRVYGTGSAYDAFTSANQLPEVFFVLIAGGALTAAFIPVYSKFLVGNRPVEAARLINGVITLVLVILGSIALLSAIFAGPITQYVLVPDYSAAQQALTASLMRIILIQTVLFGISGILSSILNAHQHFALPALAPIALDIGYVVGLYMFVPSLGIHGLAWGTVLGGFLHILIQMPALWHHRFRYRPDGSLTRYGLREIGRQMRLVLGYVATFGRLRRLFGNFGTRLRANAQRPIEHQADAGVTKGLSEIIALMGPRIIMLGTIQAADIFVLRLGSGMADGAISAYFYAYTLMQLPETLLGTAVAIVVFPTMAEYYNAGRMTELKQLAVTTLRIIWYLTIPAAAALVLLGRPAIEIFFERGAFDADSTTIVFTALAALSIRVVSEATVEIVARLFYARHNTRTPMVAYLGWFVIAVIFMYGLVGSLGVQGLAIASTLAFTFLAIALFFLNQRDIGGLADPALGKSALRAIVATGAMAAVILGIGAWVNAAFADWSWVPPLGPVLTDTHLYLALALPAGLLAYFGLSILLGGREFADLFRLVRR